MKPPQAQRPPGTAAAAPACGERKVPCPHCRGPSVYAPHNRWRPFCSERCRNGDLGDWASERLRLPAAAPPDGPDPAESP